MPAPFPARIPKVFSKTITLDGGVGSGAQGTVAVGTVTGAIHILRGSVECTTLLAGATATIEMGVAGNTASLIAQTTATEIDAGEFWQDTSPEAGVSPLITNQGVTSNIILTVATADITAGVLEVWFSWLPASAGGNIG